MVTCFDHRYRSTQLTKTTCWSPQCVNLLLRIVTPRASGSSTGRRVRRSLRSDDEVVEIDGGRRPDLDERVLVERHDRHPAEGDVLRAIEQDLAHSDSRRPGDSQRSRRAGWNDERAVIARPQHDRSAGIAERGERRLELVLAAHGDHKGPRASVGREYEDDQ